VSHATRIVPSARRARHGQAPLSPYVQKVQIALREKGVEFEAVHANSPGGGPRRKDALAARAKAQIGGSGIGSTAIVPATMGASGGKPPVRLRKRPEES